MKERDPSLPTTWKRGIWSESGIKKLTMTWRRVEEINCFSDLTAQKLSIWNCVYTAKCSQRERFSSLSLSKPEQIGTLSCKHCRNKNGVFQSWSVKNTWSVAAERKRVLERVSHNQGLRELHSHSCLVPIVLSTHWMEWGIKRMVWSLVWEIKGT